MRKPLLVALVVLGCAGAGWLVYRLANPPPSPEEARAALVECLRRDPPTFLGPLDPAEYAALPLEPVGRGVYRIGVFTLVPSDRSFEAHVDRARWMADCRGSFVRADGRWVARVEQSSIACWR